MPAATDQPLSVAFVIPYFYPARHYGGTPQSAYEVARALVKRGHRVKVLTTDSAGDARLPAGRRNIEGIDVVYYPNLSNRLAFRRRIFWPAAMFREMTQELAGSDILHIHELRSMLSVKAHKIAVTMNLPYVLSGHGGLRRLGKAGFKAAFDALWGSRILRDAAAVIAVSPAEEPDAIAMKVNPQRVRILPNMISAADYQVLPQKGRFRDQWRFGSRKTILFLGRLHWIKGADVLIRAFERIHKTDSEVRLAIAGSDDGQKAELQDLVLKLGMNHCVTFTGFLDHERKLEALVDADLLVVPSRSEVFAINVLEALMCACPALLSDACGLYPMPQREHGVRLFKNGDSSQLADNICEALGDHALPNAAQKGREFVKLEFNEDKITILAESIYRAVIR